LVSGRACRSAPISGRYTPQEALRLLLAGTGMTVRYTSAEAFMLVAETPEQTPPPESDPQVDAERARERYFGWNASVFNGAQQGKTRDALDDGYQQAQTAIDAARRWHSFGLTASVINMRRENRRPLRRRPLRENRHAELVAHPVAGRRVIK
jgi:hypothetical protein